MRQSWSRSPQVRRVQRHAVLTAGLVTLTVDTEGGSQSAQCLRIDLLPLWMSGLQASRVKEDLRDKLVQYQQEAAVVLWQAFKPQILATEGVIEPVNDQVIQQLQQIVELGYAIARMGEQQIELQRQQYALSGRDVWMLRRASFVMSSCGSTTWMSDSAPSKTGYGRARR